MTALLLAVSVCLPAHALSEGKTVQGEPWISGGVGTAELERLEQGRKRYSLRVLTAAKGSGAYLADAVVKIVDAKGATVLETRADGPWLYVNLKLGEYKVTATYKSQVRQQATKIHAGDNHEIFFYFEEPVERLPKGEKG
ncbi:MAG: carboxypeptidase regulatory-like domain-containing protein [Burkholderiales bacterium]|nr:carboxypeptidase regulatory-like domain-containing protein [Burkholderiales bacterium]